MYINKNSPIPAYYQLKKIILKKIEQGEYSMERPIPSERDLGEALGLSRMTVRQALNELVSEGVLYREKGKGTFISRTKFEQNDIMSFSDIVRKKGLIPSTRILKFEKTYPGETIADNLGISSNDSIYVLKRLRLAGEMPVGIEEAYIPGMYCPELENLDLTGSLHSLFNEHYSYAISFVDSHIEASKPVSGERELLLISAGIPVLRIDSVYYIRNGFRLFFEKSSYRSDEFTYNVRAYTGRNVDWIR